MVIISPLTFKIIISPFSLREGICFFRASCFCVLVCFRRRERRDCDRDRDRLPALEVSGSVVSFVGGGFFFWGARSLSDIVGFCRERGFGGRMEGSRRGG